MTTLMVFCTVPNQLEAEKIARTLVREKLAACVNLVPRLKSFYWWKGKLSSGNEVLLIMKTFSSKWGALEKRIQQLHSYTVPEILALPVQKGNKAYLDWMKDSLASR
jgi:periplasmic divalent cation tolerance protein